MTEPVDIGRVRLVAGDSEQGIELRFWAQDLREVAFRGHIRGKATSTELLATFQVAAVEYLANSSYVDPETEDVVSGPETKVQLTLPATTTRSLFEERGSRDIPFDIEWRSPAGAVVTPVMGVLAISPDVTRVSADQEPAPVGTTPVAPLAQYIVDVSRPKIRILATGSVGPRGPQGPPGPNSSPGVEFDEPTVEAGRVVLRFTTKWGVDASGPYFDPQGAAAGEAAVLDPADLSLLTMKEDALS